MQLDLVTLFPEWFDGLRASSAVRKLLEAERLMLTCANPRDFATDARRTVDDAPTGGGGGMVMLAQPLADTLAGIGLQREVAPGEVRVVTSARGVRFDQPMAVRWSLAERVVLVCGHYRGIDQRVIDEWNLEEVSIGDYVLTGGEPAAWVMADALVRLLPGAMGDFSSALEDSHMGAHLGGGVYTRPREWEGREVPPELLGGDPKAMRRRALIEGIRQALDARPDLVERGAWSLDEWEVWLRNER